MEHSHLRLIASLAAGIAAMVAACGCGRSAATDDKVSTTNEVAVPVAVERVVRGPIESSLATFATLDAEQEVKVFARTANRVIELLVEEGDHATRDQVLVRLDDSNQQVAVAKARNALEKFRREFQRLEALHAQQLISDQVYTDAQFELRALDLAVAEAQRELDYTVIRAPIDGTIARRHVRLGDLVTPNTHLFDLVDFDSVVARIFVPEKNLPHLRPGQLARVTATALGSRPFAGKVMRIAPVVDGRSGTVKVTIGFDAIGPLRPGMGVDVELVLDQRPDALLLSKRALIEVGDQKYAFRLDEGRRVRRLLVEPRATDRFHVEPASGFDEGDYVVIAGHTGLKDGALVRLPEDPDPARPSDGKPELRASAR